ncbi:hypothetical protein Y032_0399g743 [Ancylostoma ceylanicum]|uniref:Uncharacterized protein n=1 Tax=Ancylostoma ceylanicum TaxID=53326 RepID=A0A016RR58_9BILA|nr:hypothetical protein Y032_0399g743 [Ancylostoma ceylanicum]
MTSHLATADSPLKLIPPIALGTCYHRSDTTRQAAVASATPPQQFSFFPYSFRLTHVMVRCLGCVFAIPRVSARLFWRSRQQRTGFLCRISCEPRSRSRLLSSHGTKFVKFAYVTCPALVEWM